FEPGIAKRCDALLHALIAITQPPAHEGVTRRHPQYRRGDEAPDRDHFVHSIHCWEGQLVPGIGYELSAIVGRQLRPMRREELRLVARKTRVVLLQTIRHL